MDNMFVKKREVRGVEFTAPTFVDSGVNPNEIAYKAKVEESSGNQFVDIALGKAIEYSKKLDVIKANNEKAKLSIDLQKRLNDYENEWQTRGDNKYSDEYYDEYVGGLNAIYDDSLMNFANTKYTSENDVYEWQNGLEKARGQNLFLQKGNKAKFDIESATDETLLHVSSMANNYVMSGNYADLENAVNLLNDLSDFIPKHKLDELRRKQVMNAEQSRMKVQLDNIVNSSGSIESKRKALADLQSNVMKNKGAYELMANNAVEMGLYSDVELAKSDYQMMYQDALSNNGATLNRLESQIRADRAQVEVARQSLESKWDTAVKNETENYTKAKNTAQQQAQISILEGRTIDLFDVAETDVVNDYYGVEGGISSVVGSDKDGARIFVPTMSNTDVRHLQEQRNIIKNDPNRKYSETMVVYKDYIMGGRNTVEQNNRINELEYRGFISPVYGDILRSSLDESGNVPQQVKGSSNEQVIDYQYKGAKLVTSETESKKIKTFGLSQSLLKGKVKEKMKGLTSEQRHMVNGMIAGLYSSDEVDNFKNEPLTIDRLEKYMDVQCSDGTTVSDKIDGFIELAQRDNTPRPRPAKMKDLTDESVFDKIEDNVANGMNKVIRIDSKEVGLEPSFANIGTQIRDERRHRREQARKINEEHLAKQRAKDEEDVVFTDWN